MTAQEQQLITELFARINRTPSQAKDAGADQLIRSGVMENPQAPYLLVQTVLIQDMALSQAQHRVAELEQQLAEAKAGASAEPSQPTSETVVNQFYGDQPSSADTQAAVDDSDAQDSSDDPTVVDDESDDDVGDQDLDAEDDGFDPGDTDLT